MVTVLLYVNVLGAMAELVQLKTRVPLAEKSRFVQVSFGTVSISM